MIKDNISVYSLNIANKFQSQQLIEKELKNIYQLLKRYKDNNTLYQNISFVIGISNKSSKDCKVGYTYNNLRGKPRKFVNGTEVAWHFHIYIIGDDKSSSSSFCNTMRIHISNKKGYKTSQSKNNNINNAIKYLKKQCLRVWTCGERSNAYSFI